MSRKACPLIISSLFFTAVSLAQDTTRFTHADTVRGSVTPERAWWNVLRYDIRITPDYDQKYISGEVSLRFAVLHETPVGKKMQIDLQEPMMIDSIKWHHLTLPFTREGNAFYIAFPKPLSNNMHESLDIYYEGHPRVAVRPPWDGGWIFTRDAIGRPWMTVACQGLGASVWYPCKDYQGDEPDSGASLAITVPDTLVAVGNGRLKNKTNNGNGTATYTWVVTSPINNYDIIPYIGKYVTWHEDYAGEAGKLDCDFWVLDYNLDKARQQFKQVDSMLRCFEYWMGPYPFYEDGYKLVEAPHLGMEHQSAVAYGNHFQNGYLGRDLSGTGWGLKWDFIIVHESGHEWFGNNITTDDLADMWVHEGFTNYSEALYTTCQDGARAGDDYVIGIRKNIRNDKPIIAHYGVNEEGSGDMYYKSGNMLHAIRQILGDSVFRALLRGLNKTFYHQTVTSQEIEHYINTHSGRDFSKVFDQYLRTTHIPQLEYRQDNMTNDLYFRWTNCVKGFDMPVRVSVEDGDEQWIYPTDEWKKLDLPGANKKGLTLQADRNFYVTVKRAGS